MQPNYNRMVFLDFETTGFKENAPVSLAMIFYENGKKAYTNYSIIDPEAQIEFGAQKVHGLTQSEVREYNPFPVLWEEISPYFENSILCAHNSTYDIMKVLLPTLDRYGLDTPNNFWICDTLENAKKFIPKTEVKNYKLDTLCDYLGIKFKNHHTASFDTVGCMRIYNKLVKISKGNLIIRNKFNERED